MVALELLLGPFLLHFKPFPLFAPKRWNTANILKKTNKNQQNHQPGKLHKIRLRILTINPWLYLPIDLRIIKQSVFQFKTILFQAAHALVSNLDEIMTFLHLEAWPGAEVMAEKQRSGLIAEWNAVRKRYLITAFKKWRTLATSGGSARSGGPQKDSRSKDLGNRSRRKEKGASGRGPG